MRKSKDKSPRKPNVGPAYDLMELSFRLSMGLNVVPFTYDLKRRRFSVNPASLKFATWFVLMFLGIVVELAQMSRELIRAAVDENVSRSDSCLLCLLWTNWWFVAFSHHHILVSHQQMVEHLNQTLGSREWFTEERLPHTEDHKLVRIHLWFSNFQARSIVRRTTHCLAIFNSLLNTCHQIVGLRLANLFSSDLMPSN